MWRFRAVNWQRKHNEGGSPMKYADLVKFQPIETVIQLRDADKADEAKHLVQTFVISDRIAEQLADLMIPNLQFDKPSDNKGLLVVGTYGTGKSHLMAVISAVAEHAELAKSLANAELIDRFGAVAGKFRVIRAEIGGVTMSLRDILVSTLESHLAKLGIPYVFPAIDKITNHKDSFQEMMSEFELKFPKQGLLLIVDELLDYLLTRNGQEMMLDLAFLREVGEFCKNSRFRFISGVQESLFDNPKFQFVAQTVQKVRDRFIQLRIAREDVAFVVSQRLLKKTADQEAAIREHLTPFAKLYGSMNERMDEFVRLFPVHPSYLDTFERVYSAEKREVLKTLSIATKGLVGRDVPKDEPGLIAYDSYWQNLKDSPSYRAIPDIKEVIDKSQVLEARVQQAFTRPQYKPVALRIVYALSVHRLTQGDIFAPLGATAEELRDNLCLLLPMPEKDAEFLKTMVETVLNEIMKTVNGQFLSFNKENGQYFLDLKKDIDFDALIAKRSESLSKNQLDRYYFDALTRVMECQDQTYVSGYKIWEHEVEWRERKAGRSGYLFFGAPNERSSAQPPRDFYLYFIQAFEPPAFKDEKKPDEVFFRIKTKDEHFDTALKLYAGAREQALTASGSNKKIYEDKERDQLKALTTWLREKMTTAIEVTYQRRPRSLAEVVQGKIPSGPKPSIRDVVNTAASVCLAPHFENKAPDYPTFSILVTRENRAQAAQEALRYIAGSVKSKQGAAILDAMELLDGDVLRPLNSRYAKQILDQLAQKGKGQVLNRTEIVKDEVGVDYWERFRLEPELLVVVLGSLVYTGSLVLSVAGQKFDAGGLDLLAKADLDTLRGFKHVERPKDLPLDALQELFELLSVPKGLIVNPGTHDEAVQKMQVAVAQRLDKVVTAQAKLQDGLIFWGKPILSDSEQADTKARLQKVKDFLESLQPFNSSGKLKNFPHSVTEIHGQKAGLDAVRNVDEMVDLIQQMSATTSYLATAEAVLPADNSWLEDVKSARGDLLTKLSSPKQRSDSSFQRQLGQVLTDLKSKYRDAYLALHQKVRLTANEDKKKAEIVKDSRLSQLQKLSGIEMMPAQQLKDLQDSLFALKTCFAITKLELDAAPLCPHCNFRPAEESAKEPKAGDVLAKVDDRLDELLKEWTQTLLSNLADPTVSEGIDLIDNGPAKKVVKEFIKNEELPDPVNNNFLKALQEVLSGLQKVSISKDAVHAALVKGGVPCTVKDLEVRFDGFIRDLTKGKDATKIRVVVE
jgi:hypothetical protein